jgi:aryl-alcohol dehydrogenase-like predicted oxidoreductase
MEYRKLGRTNLNVSEIGHGLWGMSDWSGADDKESLETLQKSLDGGCNFFDSAWAYGSGHSDQLLGQLIKNNPGKNIVATSKIPPKNLKWPASSEYPFKEVYPRQHVLDYTEKILAGIGIDSIDLLQFHVWDDAWADEDEWKQTISDLKAKKLIRHFGISLNRWEEWNGMKAIETGLVDTVQVVYNVFDQAPEDELFPLCKKMNVGVIARVPLDEGGLTGKLSLDTQFPANDFRTRYFGPENLRATVERAEALKKLLPENMSLPEMALRYILSDPAVSTTIVGMRSLKHLQENLKTSDGKGLPKELITQLHAQRWVRGARKSK